MMFRKYISANLKEQSEQNKTTQRVPPSLLHSHTQEMQKEGKPKQTKNKKILPKNHRLKKMEEEMNEPMK
eukprot:m.139659 g.139659  ORF g.139659 m.139659 type:complete len:70 (+) comp13175_c0_seq2:88-297(+)